MLYEHRVVIRRVFIVALFILIIIPLISYLITLFTTGTITVTTNKSSNYINLEQVVSSSTKGTPYSKRAQGELSARVKPGTSEVIVSTSSTTNSLSRNVTIKARHHVSLSLNPVTAQIPEPVYSEASGSVYADSSQLLLIALSPSESVYGSEDGNIMQATSTGFNTLFPTIDFTEVQWVSGSLGLAQDSENNLYLINNGSLTQITLPFAVTPSTKLTSNMSKSGSIYVSDGNEVYVGTASGGFKKIYNAGDEDQIISVLAGNNKGPRR
jgi:hypothetical protein